MIIRPADIDDAQAIATVLVRSWQHAYKNILPVEGLNDLSIEDQTKRWAGWLQAESSPMQVLVAEEDDKVVGFTAWGPSSDEEDDDDTFMIYSIYVFPDYMNQGIGQALLESAEVDMIASGATQATLHVLKENTPTRKFYEHHGWHLEPDSARTEHFFNMDMITVRYRKSFS